MAKTFLTLAVAGSILAALLLAAASADIWMSGAYLHPTPRINALTVGLGIAAATALVWLGFLWVRGRPSGVGSLAFRIVASGALLVVAGYCGFASMFLTWFVG